MAQRNPAQLQAAVCHRINPSLSFIEEFRPWVYLVERKGSRYILKFSDFSDRTVQHCREWIDREITVLEAARSVQGITHLLEDYRWLRDKIGISALLKEYFPGHELNNHIYGLQKDDPNNHCSSWSSQDYRHVSQLPLQYKEQVLATIGQLHDLGIADLDLNGGNIIINPFLNGGEAKIVDIDSARIFVDGVKKNKPSDWFKKLDYLDCERLFS